MLEQAASDKIVRPSACVSSKKKTYPTHYAPLRGETPRHPGDLVRLVRLIRTFLQDQKTPVICGLFLRLRGDRLDRLRRDGVDTSAIAVLADAVTGRGLRGTSKRGQTNGHLPGRLFCEAVLYHWGTFRLSPFGL